MLPRIQNLLPEAGCDEAGRGCLAGAVFAAAVILPPGFKYDEVNDSKQLSHQKRVAARHIIEQEAIAWAIGIVLPDEIDRINILKASILAMHRALAQLNPSPGFAAIDGNRFTPFPKVAHQCVVKGDALYTHIAAASILAKTGRDDYMMRLHEEFPMYGWDHNKGYPTVQHRKAIQVHGPSPYHRLSFKLLPENQQMGLF
ncbi:MAG: ribonuclease HII [Sphingobacteriales bacterium]|nr:MAG: ribonuclease HII [Sphingobacteriales bacterium]